MNNHRWLLDVLEDLMNYSTLNHLHELKTAIVHAYSVALREVDTLQESQGSSRDQVAAAVDKEVETQKL